ncbi:MAG TPA: GNAT family N-acetyltransferase [Pyrinomonadaceae bacterium]|nr:GNAT family N-acetyltransferase [Pyrinomonadaceae bacterium]
MITQNKPVQRRIEVAREKDVPLIFGFLKELAEYEHLTDYYVTSEEQIREAFFGAQPSVEAILAYEGSETVGLAVFYYTYSTFAGSRGIYLEDLYVKTEARGKGVAKELLAYLARLGMDQGCTRMDWAVLDWNELAKGFYRRIGARPIEGWSVYRLDREAFAKLSELSNVQDAHRL